MTASKVIARLAHWQPQCFAAMPLVSERCVLATRVGIDVLARFGIGADPRPVIAAVWNRGYEHWRRLRDEHPELALDRTPPADAWSVWSGWPDDDRELKSKHWRGHLVVWVPQVETMLDLDFQQFNRPAKQLVVPPAFAIRWPAGSQTVTAHAEFNGQPVLWAHYARNDENTAFLQSLDWTGNDRDWVVAAVDSIERAIRKGGKVDARQNR